MQPNQVPLHGRVSLIENMSLSPPDFNWNIATQQFELSTKSMFLGIFEDENDCHCCNAKNA